MATYFDTDNIPGEIHTEPIGEQHFDAALEIIADSVGRGEVAAYQVKAAFVYERRQWLETEAIVGPTPASNADLDDILVQVTVRIPRTSLFNNLEAQLHKEKEWLRDENARAAAAAEIAAIEAEERHLAVRKARAMAKFGK